MAVFVSYHKENFTVIVKLLEQMNDGSKIMRLNSPGGSTLQ